jgi:hypothetical protein
MAFPTQLRTILALTCAGVLAAPAAQAAVFAVVRTDMDGVTVMDPAAIEPVPGSDSLRRAWSVRVQKSLVSEGPPQPGYVRTLNEYDCKGRQVRWKNFSVYSRFGASVMQKDNDSDAWKPIAPRSDGEAELRLVCDRDNRSAAIASASMSQLVISLMQAWDAAAPLPPLQPVQPVPKPPAANHRDKPAPRR